MMWQARRAVTPASLSSRAPALPKPAGKRPAVFSYQAPHRIDLRVTLGQQPLELAVFVFEFLETAHILALEAIELALPGVGYPLGGCSR